MNQFSVIWDDRMMRRFARVFNLSAFGQHFLGVGIGLAPIPLGDRKGAPLPYATQMLGPGTQAQNKSDAASHPRKARFILHLQYEKVQDKSCATNRPPNFFFEPRYR